MELLEGSLVQIDEGISQLSAYGESIELNPAELENVELRLQVILDLARKHHVEPKLLVELHQQLLNELNDIGHADERLEELRSEYKTLQQTYQNAAEALSSSRSNAAIKLNNAITSAMQTLGMSGGQFIIEITPLNTDKYAAHGIDRVTFTVTANSGQACKALSRVASGGELARISLAIQMIAAAQTRIPTLIFDEVDSGVGGGIAEIVGQHLRILGNSNQAICITHLPQVASQAHNHMLVHKQSDNEQTRTSVETLDRQQRIDEIARMLSGVDITQQSLAHAEEMITRAEVI